MIIFVCVNCKFMVKWILSVCLSVYLCTFFLLINVVKVAPWWRKCNFHTRVSLTLYAEIWTVPEFVSLFLVLFVRNKLNLSKKEMLYSTPLVLGWILPTKKKEEFFYLPHECPDFPCTIRAVKQMKQSHKLVNIDILYLLME